MHARQSIETLHPARARRDADAGEADWCLRQERFDPAGRARDESLFALANGSLGVRGNFEEAVSPSDGCFLASVYERHPIEFHERLPGFARATDTRVPVADGKHIAIVLDGETVDPWACEWLAFARALDLRRGVLIRHTRLRTPRGAVIDVDSERLVSAHDDVLAIRYRVAAVDYAGSITLASAVRTGQRPARQGEDPRIGVIGDQPLPILTRSADADVACLAQRTQTSAIALCCAQAHRTAGDGLAFVSADVGEQEAVQRFAATLARGEAVVLEKFVAYATSGEGATDAAMQIAQATSLARSSAQAGYAAIAERRAQAQAEFWRGADVVVDHDARTTLSLRANLFHLMQSAGRGARDGTAAKGLTGEGYEGHYFWDTEAFMLPVMVHTAPEIARAMLLYRHRTLDAARANARELNHARGALYPWRTIAGAECSAHYPSGSAAYHINAAIAYAIGLYVDATDDHRFLLEAGAEMLFETARIWPLVGHFDPLRDGAFGIHDVTGPDEYTALVDNNFYTNRMAQRHLLRAAATWDDLSAREPDALQALASRLALTGDEVDGWRHAAEAMALPVDARLDIYAQDDTFLHKPRWDFAAHDSGRPLLLDCHPLTLYRHQVCKQADVVMALVLAGDGLDAGLKRRSFDYYEAITTHDSTLSPAVHGILASELGLADKALSYFTDALRVDLDDLHGNTSHGVHMAAMAGSWLGLVWGFAGLRTHGATLAFSPTLPPGWRGYGFSLRWRGRRLQVRVDREGVDYALLEDDAPHGVEPLRVAHRGEPVELDARTAQRRMRHVVPTTHAKAVFPRPCAALIFDLDGVLTDTAHVHYQAWKRLADGIGVPFDETVNRRLKGVDRAASLEIILERAQRAFGDDEKRALAERKNDDYRAAIAKFGPADLFAGARELLHAARTAGLRTALASASRNAAELVERLGIRDAFDVVVDAGTVARQKPAPDIFLAAADALGVAPEHCIGIEDAAAGVAAIHAAGMAAIGIGDAVDLAQADAVVPAIARIDLSLFVSPVASGTKTAIDPPPNRKSHTLEGAP